MDVLKNLIEAVRKELSLTGDPGPRANVPAIHQLLDEAEAAAFTPEPEPKGK